MELFRLLGTVAIDGSTAIKETNKVVDNAENAQDKMSKAFKKIGTVVASAFAIDKIKDFGMTCLDAAADAAAVSSQFTQTFGDLEADATESLNQIANQAGMLTNRMKGSYTQIAAFAKTTGLDTASALELSNRAMVAVADSAAFYDRSLEEATESLQSFLKGNYENDAALGLSCTEVTRNAAANELYGTSFKNLSEAQKQLHQIFRTEEPASSFSLRHTRSLSIRTPAHPLPVPAPFAVPGYRRWPRCACRPHCPAGPDNLPRDRSFRCSAP